MCIRDRVVGVGLFTTGAQCVGVMGAGVILLTFIGLLICILPALMYAEMGAALPNAGGTYNYAKRAISVPVANISAWHYLIALIATVSYTHLDVYKRQIQIFFNIHMASIRKKLKREAEERRIREKIKK